MEEKKKVKITAYILVFVGKKPKKLLLVKRKDFPVVWEAPGGGIEFGEHPKNTAIRELEEETGIRVDENSVKLFTVSSTVYSNGKEMQIPIFYFIVLDKEIVPTKLPEHSDYRYVTFDELTKMLNSNESVAASIKSIVDELKNFMNQ